MVLADELYVDLNRTRLDKVQELVIYCDGTVGEADRILRSAPRRAAPALGMTLRVGTKLLFEMQPYEVSFIESTAVYMRGVDGEDRRFPLQLARDLYARQCLDVVPEEQHELAPDLTAIVANRKSLARGLKRLEALNTGEGLPSKRTVQRWRKRAGTIASPDRLKRLMPDSPANRLPRLPESVVALAFRSLTEHHNTAVAPPIASTYLHFVVLCDEAGERPMSRSSFYEWIRLRSSVLKREGRRKAYQEAPIRVEEDNEHSVHGVLPHEVVYIDHTPLNLMCVLPNVDSVHKPVLTLAVDGSNRVPRAVFISYRPACTQSVLMVLRDYCRRHNRLPRTIVLDNGREFHSQEVEDFCSAYGVNVRWRRRSRPRDSGVIERAIGMTETEVLASMRGNSIRLKDPRMVSTSHKPEKHAEWTLPRLYLAMENFLFDVFANRVHPRLGKSPLAFEAKQLLQFGSREHVIVRYDQLFKLLSSAHPEGQQTRKVDRRKGVYVGGLHFWNDKLAVAKSGETVEVRIETWNASVIYACYRDDWIVLQARDFRRLQGRTAYEAEMELREEALSRRTVAQRDKVSVAVAKKKMQLTKSEYWDPRLRAQQMEEHYLYTNLNMTEALPDAVNVHADVFELGTPHSSHISQAKYLVSPAEVERRKKPNVRQVRPPQIIPDTRQALDVAPTLPPAVSMEDPFF